jgi:hypothetical protein
MERLNFVKGIRLACLFLLCACAGCSTPRPAANELQLGGQRIKFNPNSDDDLHRLGNEVAAALDQLKKQPKTNNIALQDAAKKYKRGLQEIQRLARAAKTASTPEKRRADLASLLEVVAGVNNDQREPVPERVDVVELPWMFLSALHHPVGRGETPAADLQPGPQADLSLRDPMPSTFWQRPTNIAAADLYHGFGRTNLTALGDTVCTYAGPKDSYGTNPGFEVDANGVTVKLKFAEIHSEPVTTRIFEAMGFNADPTDYEPEVHVRYNRDLFLQFNSRRELTTRFTMFGLTYYTMRLQKKYDPFRYIVEAVMRDGRHLNGNQFKAALFRDCSRKHPETDPANYRHEVETNIDYLVTVAANVQPKDVDIKRIGSWDHGQLDHPGRRELRGAGLLAAWLGFFDTRYDNMRVRLVRRDGHEELRHYFSDLGGGMGQTTGLLFMHGERPNDFPWTFTEPPLQQGPGKMVRPLRIVGYKPIAPTESFAAMTLDDARWMARLVGQLSEAQITEALIASGYDSAEVRLYTGKLISRRDRMIQDLGLSGEIPPLRPAGIDRKFACDPAKDSPVSVPIPGGGTATAPIGDSKIVLGRLITRQKPRK